MPASPFKSDQAIKIVELISQKYNLKPDFPFREFPDYAVFRHEDNRKWFALFMNIPPYRLYEKYPEFKSKLSKEILEKAEIEVLDLKLPHVKIQELVNNKAIFLAYHMNKKYWVSVLLDGDMGDDEIIDLVDESFKETIK